MLKDRSINDAEIVEVLEGLNKYIFKLAWRKIPRYTTRSEELDLEIDELVQRTRIKLWQALQKGHVINPTAYARSIVFTESVNMQRRYKPEQSLSNEEADNLYCDQGVQDPSENVEHAEELTACIEKVLRAILALPPCQKQAMICSLKDNHEDALPLLIALTDQGIDIESIHWPEGKAETQRLRASLAVSRKKLRYVIAESTP